MGDEAETGPRTSFVVAGGLIESDEGLLLVQNRRRGGRVDWSPPGGVIDEGEGVLEGLTREVFEETGLTVREWAGPVYEVEATAPGLGWHLRVEVWCAVDFEGELVVEDPDGIVVDARFVRPDELPHLVRTNHPWVVEPLNEYLAERWEEQRTMRYHVEGSEIASLVVTRL
jgi:8-oxo-dGTP diphosphatase